MSEDAQHATSRPWPAPLATVLLPLEKAAAAGDPPPPPALRPPRDTHGQPSQPEQSVLGFTSASDRADSPVRTQEPPNLART